MTSTNAHHLKWIRLAFTWAAFICAYYYLWQVIIPNLEARKELVEAVVAGTEKADYMYQLFFVANLHHWLSGTFGHPLLWHVLTDCGGMLFMFWSAYRFIKTSFGSMASYIAGLFCLIIPMPMFLIDHFYHPTDFWAVGLVFFMIEAARKENTLLLAGLLFISGMLWEKALFVPAIFGLYMWFKKGFFAAFKSTLIPAVATLFWFVWFRVTFPDAPRVLLLTTTQFFNNLPVDLLTWVLWLGPLGFAVSKYFKEGWKSDPFWMFWLLYIPILIITLISLTAYWGELRTFWILQPIIVSFVAAIFHRSSINIQKLSTDSY